MGKSCEILNYVFEGKSINSVQIDGIDGLVDALIDSGCNACLVKRDILPDSIKSKIEPCWTSSSNYTPSATLADGSPMKILGRVNLRVSCLGTTWIRKSRAVLQSDGRKLGVTFDGKKEKKGCRTDVCPSPYVSVKVDGISKKRSALVDTGATRSYIKKEIVTEPIKSKAIPTYNTTTIANGTQIEEMTEHHRQFEHYFSRDCHLYRKR